MTTFAVTNPDETIDALNYVLSNLNTGSASGNVTIPGNVLVANATSGSISTYGNASVISYQNEFLNIRYANNSTGSSGFSTNQANAQYYGVYNTSTNTAPGVTNPANYQWSQVTGGFGTTKTLYYLCNGGRQVQLSAAVTAPSTGFLPTVNGTPIDLDIVTTATGTPGERGAIAMAYVITPNDPNTSGNTALSSWFSASRTNSVPPIGTGLTPVSGDTSNFYYPTTAASGTYTFDGSGWVSVVGQVVAGNTIVNGTITGNTIANNTITGNNIVVASVSGDKITANTLSGNAVIANTLYGNAIIAGTISGNAIIANTISGNSIIANTFTAGTINGNAIVAGSISGNSITANSFSANTINGSAIVAGSIAANTINGNSIVAGSITADQLAANVLTANTVVSQGATIGNFASQGFWLQGSTGNARFGNAVNIGSQLTVGNNASIGGNLTIGANLTVSGLIQQGNLANGVVNTVNLVDLSVTNSSAGDANPSPTQITYTNNSALYPNNTRGYAINNGVAIIPTTTSATQGSKILVNYQTYISSATSSEYNLVELWKDSVSYSSQYNLKHIFTAQNFGNGFSTTGSFSPGYMQPMYCVGTNGATLYSNDLGQSWINASNANITTNWSSTFGYANVNYGGSPGGINVYPGTYYFNKFDSNGVYYAGNVTLSDASLSTNLGGVVSSSVNFTANSAATINDVVLMTSGFNPNVVPYYDTIPASARPIVYVGNGGKIYSSSGYLTGNTWNSKAVAESSGVSSDLYAIGVDNYYEQGRYNNNVSSIVVGAQGTILTNSRVYNGSTGALISSSGWTQRISGVAQNLNGIGYDPVNGIWMIAGDNGTILKSTNAGSSWTKLTSGTAANLNDVYSIASPTTVGGTYNYYWVVVGAGGVILVSTNAGVTWTSVSSPASDGSLTFLRTLNSITYQITNPDTGNPVMALFVAGDGIIMKSVAPYTSWSIVYDAGYVQNSNLVRVEYYGSYADPFTVTQPSTIQRLGNNQVVTGTFIDTDFTAGNPIKYYIVAGSLLANNPVYVQGSSITATELKR